MGMEVQAMIHGAMILGGDGNEDKMKKRTRRMATRIKTSSRMQLKIGKPTATGTLVSGTRVKEVGGVPKKTKDGPTRHLSFYPTFFKVGIY